ncbi:MAG TPA: glycosyltransferase [Vicinamibacterales bacterium]|nr:glycosyltransferase [Vicinamibacterales bacterium]
MPSLDTVRGWVAFALTWFTLAVLAYFLVLNTLYLVFSAISFLRLREHRRRWTRRELDAVIRSPATPGISLIVPAYNEEATIVESVRALLLLNYPSFEIVVVNDGAKDRTMDVIIAAYGMLPAPASYPQQIHTQPVRGFYRSLAHPELVVIDKANGGKADAINAGINAAQHGLVCVIDADSILEEHALTRVVLPFIEDPDTVASGGIVRIVNGSTVEAGKVTRMGLPKTALATFQVVEYLRAFLAGRTALSAGNLLLIISGAFGLFRREAVIAVGGFRVDTVGEDMEIVTRLHRVYREQGRRYRIVFQPDPVCWTEAPETRQILGRQRNRWQRGTLQVLGYHRRMIANPRYGAVGLIAMPYYLIFEAAGPIIEFLGFAVTLLALAFGLLNVRFAELLFLSAVAYGAMISMAAVLLQEIALESYPRARDLLVLAVVGIVENFGYRQLTTWWRFRGMVDYMKGKSGWGTMTRRGFSAA